MTFVVTTPPSEEPVSLIEAREQCRVSSSKSDTELLTMIKVARLKAESILHRWLVTQTISAHYDSFHSCFHLPPIQSVSSISYLDSDGISQVLASDQYVVDSSSVPARITPAYNVSWPSTYDQVNAVTISFVAGYGAASAVPETVKQWILIQVNEYFDNRTATIVGAQSKEMPRDFLDGLLDSERVLSRV